MINQQLVDYVRGQLAAGISEQVIRTNAAAAGWSAGDIEDAFGAARGAEARQSAPLREVSPEAAAGPRTTGLSGNEIFCLSELGYAPGDIAVGNSVHALGVLRSIGSGARMLMGGEITQITSFISDGRHAAITRLEEEARLNGGAGVTGVTTEVIASGDRLEFLSIGSVLHGKGEAFSSSADGQELYCQIDAGYTPKRFVFGNVAYSIGIGRGVTGLFRQLVRGEVPQYTEIFTKTRNLALDRIVAEAKQAGANAVVNIRAQILPISGAGYGMQEMILIGTASHNPALPPAAADQPATSDLINQELWSLANKGYVPLKLMMGTSVYALGLVGGITLFFKSFRRGEIPELTKLVYEAREKSITKIKNEAARIGADDVVGVKIYLYELGSGLIEVLAIGTAVKREGGATQSPALLPQAIINDKDTFVDRTMGGASALSRQSMRAGRGIIAAIVPVVVVIIYIIVIIVAKANHS
ncbi:MAG: heavy metal-binding domain-containing protein [Minisyncoccia bacterium]